MIEYSILLNYGVLGCWTIYLLYKEKLFISELKKLIKNNTLALNKVSRLF